MATETATDAIYRALSSPEPDPKVVHNAIEEIRDLRGQNFIAEMTEVNARIDVQGSRLESQITEVKAEIKAQISRIDILQRVIWLLFFLLVTTVFGLLYRVVTTS